MHSSPFDGQREPSPQDCVPALIRARAEQAPQTTAVIGADRSVSYGELLAAADALAGALAERGSGPGDVVGVCLERSPDMVVALLGILFAGAAYLPVEVAAPPARVQQMLAAASVRILLTEPAVRARSGALAALAGPGAPSVADVVDLTVAAVGPPAAGPGLDDLAYVLFTSGSTGEPKGVAMTHRPLRNLIDHQLASSGRHHAGRPMRTLQFTPLTFDVSFLDIFATLAAGGTVVLPSDEQRRDPAELLAVIREREITSLFLPLVALQQLADAAADDAAGTPSLREVMTGGEQLVITPPVARWFGAMPQCTLQNIYGPTETHLVTVYDLDGDPASWPTLAPIGYPIAGADLLLLDEQRRRVGPGETGEIWVSGVCLARGYAGRPDLTAERFVALEPGGPTYYRTGDLAASRPDGCLQYLGRVDRQVKIQGVRVEPAEIESVLAGHPEVRACAVEARDASAGGKRLVAYVVPQRSGAAADPPDFARLRSRLRDHLAARLHEAMVPTAWHLLDSLPLTTSGKVDRRALPEVSEERPQLMTPLAAPRTPAEQRTARVWRDALGLNTVGADDNFFDLGGTSLLAVAVVRRLREEFGGELPVVALYENPTVRTLASRIAGGSESAERLRGRAVRRPAGPDADPLDTAVAIVGMACRFPGADSPEAFWRNLCSGVESITLVEAAAGADADFVPAVAVLPDIEEFDAELFGISPQEARLLDPQHRLFLECAWEALQDAGDEHGPGRTVGVFGGTGPSTYLFNNVHPAIGWRADRTFLDSAADLRLLIANDKDFLTSLVSYKLDLRGPSLNVNAACATSLIAVHYARRALLDGDCDVAVAGAACVPVPQLAGHYAEPSMPFSPDGHCRAFDERAEGTVFGSGVGAVVLKRLADALADGDDVYAVVRGSAVNNDGSAKVGMTAPSVEGQARAVADALADAAVEPRSVRFVEAHGTATPVGDPIEVAALKHAFGPVEPGRCALGSVKTNVGHLGWAAGMAGLIKTALALRHRRIPPTLHYVRPNPELGLEDSPFYVNTVPIDFPVDDVPRRAGVSAFGLGGANAHLVLEEAPQRADVPEDDEAGPDDVWRVLPFSGRSVAAVAGLAERYGRYLLDHPEASLDDVAVTAARGRTHFEVRRAVVGVDRETLVRRLDQVAAAPAPRVPEQRTGAPRIAALFTGHGGEYYGMAQGLYRAEPAFRKALNAFDEPLRRHVGATAAELLYDPAAKPGSGFTDLVVGHALVFAVQVSLARFWESLGVHFDAVLGHSLGEYAAACVAGVFDAEDGLALMVERGRLMARLPGDGRMARVAADEEKVRAVLAELDIAVELAVVNSPTNCVVSGPEPQLRAACAALAERGFEAEVLRLVMAGHSAMMDPILDEFAAAAARIRLGRPTLDLVSSRTGQRVTDAVTRPEYWSGQVRHTVRFSAAVEALAATGVDAFVELGGAPNLLGIAQEVLRDHPGLWVPTLRRDRPDAQTVAEAVARLYEAGADIAWDAVGRAGRKIHLPAYPFQRRRHWIDAPAQTGERPFGATQQPATEDWPQLQHEVVWQPVDLPPVGERQGTDSPRATDRWLLFADALGVGTSLAEELRGRGETVVLVHAGAGYRRVDDEAYTIDPENPDDYRELLAAEGDGVAGIVHLWTADAATPDVSDDVDLVGAIRPALHSALLLLQAAGADVAKPPPLFLVSRGAVSVTDDDAPTAVTQAPIWGLGRVAAVERPDLLCQRIDLPADAAPDSKAVADLVLGTRIADRELALRAGQWFAPRLVRRREAAAPPRLRDDVTYLLAGGLGGLGLRAAAKLAELGARRLVLVGRSAPTGDVTDRIAALTAQGVEVVTAAVDVTDRAQVERLLDEQDGAGRPVAGIIHFAGVLDDGMLTEMTWPRFAAVLAPKVQGAWNLHAACAARGAQLDFFVLYSSATAILGNFGQANYAAANAFLDALAHHRKASGLPAMSMNWGAWSGVGGLMSRPEVLAQVLRRGMGHFTADAGAAALAANLRGAAAQTAILPNDWDVFLPAHNLTGSPFFSRLGVTASRTASAVDIRPALARAEAEPRAALLLEHIKRVLEQVTGESAAALDEQTPLRELGMDSLSAIQVRNELQRGLGCSLPPRLLFNHRVLGSLTAYLAEEVLDEAWRTAVLAEVTDTRSVAAVEPAATAAASVHVPALSIQQRRWLRLVREVRYGQRVVPAIFHVRLDRSALTAALRAVVGRHELLRYRYPDGVVEVLPVDQVLPADDELFHDLTAVPRAQLPEAVARQVEHCQQNMPDPYERPSWTVRCLELAEDRFMLLLGGQHLEFDGSGLSVFLNELQEAFQAAIDGRAPELPAVTQYREYVEYQSSYLKTEIEHDRAYFSGLFAALPRTTALPGRPGFANTFAAPSRRYTPSTPLADWDELAAAADGLGVSPFGVLLASYARTLGAYLGEPDVVVSVIRSGRGQARFASTIGPFTAPFPLPIRLGGDEADLVRQCHRLADAMVTRPDYPSIDLIEAAPAFAGFPQDTYFSDVSINFLNYRRRERTGPLLVEVPEVLGEVEHPDLSAARFGELRRIPGFHLVADVVDGALVPNYWFHADRVAEQVVRRLAEEHREAMERILLIAGKAEES